MATTIDTNQLKTDQLKENLTNQGVDADKITIADNELKIAKPGVSVDNLFDFFLKTLGKIPALENVLPESLPTTKVQLAEFTFAPTSKETPYKVEMTLEWPDLNWDLAPDIITFSHPGITVGVNGGHAYGALEGDAKVGEIPLHLTLELPGTIIKADLPKDKKDESANDILQKFQVADTKGTGTTNKGIDLGSLTLQQLSLLGNIKGRRVLFNLALGYIQLGPGQLETQLTIDYIGGKKAQVSGQVFGQYDIFRKGSDKDVLFSLMLLAAYDGPGKNWKFAGGGASGSGQAVTIKDLIEAFTDAKGIPGVFDDLGVKYLHLSYETGPGNFEFQCDVEVDDIFGDKSSVEMIVDVHLHKVGDDKGKDTKYEKTFSGRLIFQLKDGLELEFDLLFDQAPAEEKSDPPSGDQPAAQAEEPAKKETRFVAAYKSHEGTEISIGDLVRAIDPDLSFPLSINLQDAFFLYDKKADSQSHSLFGLDIGGGVDLAALPLVGKILPKKATLNFDIQPLIALGQVASGKAYFTEADLVQFTHLIPGGGITLPAREIKEAVSVGINIALGKDITFHFDLPLKTNTKPEKKAPEDKTKPIGDDMPPVEKPEVPTTTATSGTTPAPAGLSDSGASGIQWVKVNKGFGPVQFNRIGLQFEQKSQKVWAYLDAGLKIGPLTFTLYGLGMGTPVNKIDPEFRLLGLGFDYHTGPVEIGAAFLRMHIDAVGKKGEDGYVPAHDEYSGLAIIQTSKIGLSAVGSYADLPDYKSLFIYAALNMPLGGPSFFFVTGLAAGFGYNRAIRMPEVANVGLFPLVNLAVEGAGSPAPENPGDRVDYIHDILDQMRDSIYPMKGQYFLAAGIHFTSFQLIDSFVLLIVNFGEHFEVDVLGLSTVIVPTPVAGEQAVTPIAEIQLALKAVFNPSEGILSVEAQLTNNSFIIDHDCHLTGGFAFYSWFAGEHQGDFVLSVGGYHPDFKKPKHYPDVPRLGLNWQVTPDLFIKGGIYFALCPHIVMAGGKLEAMYKSGTKKAWFTLEANFLLSWKPYHYDARVSLEIGVEYTFHCFGTHHINTHLDAEVHVWGPDFAGHAHIHLACVTFNIDFGAKTTPKLDPISWDNFRKSFLPKDDKKMVHMSVLSGLVRKEKAADGKELHVINPKDFKLGMDLVIPYDSWKIADTSVEVKEIRRATVKGKKQILPFVQEEDTYQQPDIGKELEPGAFGIASMALKADQVKSALVCRVEKHDPEKAGTDEEWGAVEEHFGFQPVLKRIPRALWGEKLEQDKNGERYVENALAGLELIPKTPPKPGETQWIAKHDLQYTTTHVEPGIAFETITAFTSEDGDKDLDISANLVDPDTVKKRRELLQNLGLDYDRLGMKLTPEIADALVLPPQVGQLT